MKSMGGEPNPIVPTETKTVTCKCGNVLEKRVIRLYDRDILSSFYCDACCERHAREEKEEEASRERKSREEAWEKLCPQGYKDTNPEDPRLNSRAAAVADRWDFKSPRGIAFVGDSGTGKTRCMFLALKRAHFGGMGCRWISHNRFSKLVIDAFSGEDSARENARTELDRLEHTKILLIDDLGKAPSTERVDAELEELVENRTAAKRPILWTANAGGAWLAKRFGADRGEPIVRRLAEFCDVEVIR